MEKRHSGLLADFLLIGTIWLLAFAGFAVLYGTKSLLRLDIVPGMDMLDDDVLQPLKWRAAERSS